MYFTNVYSAFLSPVFTVSAISHVPISLHCIIRLAPLVVHSMQKNCLLLLSISKLWLHHVIIQS